MNRVILVGRLTRDPELRHTNSNIAVCQFTVAVNRRYQQANQERQADFINCVVWRQQAENLCRFTKKGAMIGVEGQIQTRQYDEPSGQRRYITEVICDSITFLSSSSTSQTQRNSAFDVNQYDIPEERPQMSTFQRHQNSFEQPQYSAQSNEKDPFEGLQSTYNFSDDDLPF